MEMFDFQTDKDSFDTSDNRSNDLTVLEISSPQLVSTPTEEGHQTQTLQGIVLVFMYSMAIELIDV